MVVPASGPRAAVLPDDRAEAMYHYYDGGGVEVSGPALLVRKGFAEKVSVSAGHYVDNVTSASPDVLATASPYEDKREEYTAGLSYLHGDTLMEMSYTSSDESDYEADTLDLGVSQEMFGGMTTVSMGYTRGHDVVEKVTDPTFREEVERYQYRLGVSQVLTKTLLVNIAYEAVSDEGYLNNPYRSKRILGAFAGTEEYPDTRTSNAIAVRVLKYLDYGASAGVEYRYYTDTWDIDGHTMKLKYRQYLGDRWRLEARYRYYTQDKASFYSDNFDREFNFMARDKELSTFASHGLGATITYDMLGERKGFVEKATLNMAYDLIQFDYDNYTDASTTGDTPYSFSADVVQLYVSAWY